MIDKPNIQPADVAGLVEDIRDAMSVDAANTVARIAADWDETRRVLAHTDLGSLPNDWTLSQVAEARINDMLDLRAQVRDTCRRAEAAEQALAAEKTAREKATDTADVNNRLASHYERALREMKWDGEDDPVDYCKMRWQERLDDDDTLAIEKAARIAAEKKLSDFLTDIGRRGFVQRSVAEVGMFDAAIAHGKTKLALKKMTEALTDLVSECEEYARVNHLHNADGSPATTGAMKHAYAVLAILGGSK
jgi:hypothetical protein